MGLVRTYALGLKPGDHSLRRSLCSDLEVKKNSPEPADLPNLYDLLLSNADEDAYIGFTAWRELIDKVFGPSKDKSQHRQGKTLDHIPILTIFPYRL